MVLSYKLYFNVVKKVFKVFFYTKIDQNFRLQQHKIETIIYF